jgi:LysM repeat protein
MKKDPIASAFFSLGMLALLVSGCGEKKIANTEVPKSPETKAEVKVETPQPAVLEKYVVKSGDTLWAISDQQGNYSDPFQWPLIFKTNRDEIQDPDLIKPGQVLLIQRGQSAEQTEHTRKLASDTPVFVTHEEPRANLPINYF